MVLVELPQKQWSDLIASYHEEHGVGLTLVINLFTWLKLRLPSWSTITIFPSEISNLWSSILRLCKYPVFCQTFTSFNSTDVFPTPSIFLYWSFGILPKKQLFFLPVSISRDAWLFALFNRVHVILMLRLSQIQPVGTSLSQLLCNLLSLHPSSSVSFCGRRCAGLIFHFSYPGTGISLFLQRALCRVYF